MRIREFKRFFPEPPSDFIFTVEVAASETVRLPFYGASFTGMNPEVDWGDTNSNVITDTTSPTQIEHTYTNAGTYTITVAANDVGRAEVYFFTSPFNGQLKTIEKFGWARIATNAFSNCTTLTAINDTEIREVGSGDNSGSGLFQGCTALTTVAGITYPFSTAQNMFNGCTSLTDVAAGFNFSQATSCYRLFYGCSALANAHAWDFSLCTDLGQAFYQAFNLAANVVIPANTTTGNVTNWSNTFSYCKAAELQALNFTGATSIDSLATYAEIQTVRAQDFSTIENLNNAFRFCEELSTFEAPVFNTTTTYTMTETFRDCISMASFPDLATTNCASFNATFYGCTAMATAPMLDFTSTTTLNSTFARCSILNSVPAWDITPLTEMGAYSIYNGTFGLCNFTALPNLDYSNVQIFNSTFESNSNLATVGSEFNATAATWHNNTFSSCTGMTSVTNFPMDNVTYINYTFYNCTSLTSVPNIDVTGCPIFQGFLSRCTSMTTYPTVNTVNCTSLRGMFDEMTGLTAIPVVNTSNCTNFSFFFNRLTQFATIPEGFDFTKGTNFSTMMQDCHFTSLPTSYIGSFNEALDISYMFWRCDQLQSFPAYDFPKATNIDYTWRYCNNLAGDPFPTMTLPMVTEARDTWEFGMDAQSCTDMLNSLATNNLQTVSGETLDFGNSNYITAQIGTSITDLQSRGWNIITGGGI